MKCIKYIFSIILLFFSLHSFAEVATIKARMDSVQLLMGKISMINLQIVQNEGQKGYLPLFSSFMEDGVIPICGDSVELRTSIKADTIKLGSGKEQIDLHIPVQSFDSGAYIIPPFVYVSGKDTTFSNALSIKVIPVNVNANDQISDYASIEEPNGNIFDFIPDWVLELWWIWLSIIILIVLFIIGIKRYKKQGTLIKKKPEPSPYEVAIRRLSNLKQRRLWEQGMEKEYFTLLTDILREYLEKRFGINAVEMTTQQIIKALADNEEVKNNREYMRKILEIADFVKFAKIKPLADDNIGAFENALKFVESTKPIVSEIENSGKEGEK